MKSLLELLLIGLCVITVTLLACWGWWELRHWWQMRQHRRASSSPWEEETH